MGQRNCLLAPRCPTVNIIAELKTFFCRCFFLAMKFEKDYEKRFRTIRLWRANFFPPRCEKSFHNARWKEIFSA